MKLKIIGLLLVCFCTVSQASSPDNQLRFNHLTVDDGLSQNSIHAICRDKFGFVWLGTWEGLNRYDGYSFRVFRANEDDPHSLSNNRINLVFADINGELWVETADPGFLFRYNYDSESFVKIRRDRLNASVAGQLRRLHKDSAPKAVQNTQFRWEIGKNGLVQTNKKTARSFCYPSDYQSPSSLSDNKINVLYLDNNSNLWVGTQNSGVYVASLHAPPFSNISIEQGTASDRVIRAICQDKRGQLWLGTEANGLYIIDRNAPNKAPVHLKAGLIDPNIRQLYCDHSGNLWVGTKGGLDRIGRDGRIQHYYAGKNGSIPNPWVFWMMEDHQGKLWVATFDGIALYDVNSDSFSRVVSAPQLRSAKVRVILEDYRNNLWIATEGGGISCLKPTGKTNPRFVVRHYVHVENNPNSLINNLVLTMTEDQDHQLWIGTNSGLCKLNPATGHFQRFSVATGFPDDLIMGLLADKQGHVWISHKQGLSCMDIHSFVCRTFNRYDGLQSNEFTQNAFFKNSVSGEMFFGGIHGVNAFFPEQIGHNFQRRKVVFTGLKIMNQLIEPGKTFNGRVVLPRSMLSLPQLTLNWEDANFSITFSCLYDGNNTACRYRYRLMNLDKDWIYTEPMSHEATFSHLPSGKYTLLVEAANNDGLWSGKAATLVLVIVPPWWWTWWSKLIYAALAMLLAWLVYVYLRERIEMRNKLLMEKMKAEKNEELMNLKLRFFTEISHEFRTPLTLIIDPLEKLLEGNNTGEQISYYHRLMQRNAKQLLELINQLLDFRKLQSGGISPHFQTANMVGFMRNVLSTFEQRAFEQHIGISFLPAANELLVDFDPDKMKKIVNNLIANALKFSRPYGTVFIRLRLRNSDFILEFEDTGPGIAKEDQKHVFDVYYQATNQPAGSAGSGIGLALVQELVGLHRGTIELESEIGQGSCFRLIFPIKQDGVDTIPFRDFEQPLATLPIMPDDDEPNPDNEYPLLLLVDDQEDIRDYIRIRLQNSYRIVTATDGLDGLRKAIGLIPDLIVSDIMMPGMDGVEFCSKIKSDEHTSHIPVILLTARQSDESRIEGYQTGADAYITKPFNLKVLQSRITNLLLQRRKMQELYGNGLDLDIKRISVNVTDEAFLQKVVDIVNANISNPDFDQEILAEKLHMSKSQLYRKIKSMTNRTVHEFIVAIRMNVARELLLAGEYSISEIAYQLGFSLPTNFTRTFSKHVGMSPSRYIQQYKR